MTQYLHGIHDPGAEDLHGDKPGWTLATEEVGLNARAQGNDYRPATRRGIGVLVRINHGYGNAGTLPLPHQYQDFAAACASFVATSQGISYVIIGNEPNGEWERPNGVVITAAEYARCFLLCSEAIKRAVPGARVMHAAIAPYHASPTPWFIYLRDVLRILAPTGLCDALNFHGYARSMNPAELLSEAKMDKPLQDKYYGFLTVLDAIEEVPRELLHLPAFITEFDVVTGWEDRNTGIITAMYDWVHGWNRGANLPQFQAAVNFRWLGPPDVENVHDWEMRNKPQLLQDFRAAVARGYQSPQINAQNYSDQGNDMQTFIPAAYSDNADAPALSPRDWDERLTQRGVTIETPSVAPGDTYWRVVAARWYSEAEAGGRHHIYVEALDENGKLRAGFPFVVKWPSGRVELDTNGRNGFDAGNFPMSKSLNEFSVAMTGGGYPSDAVKGIGMGADGNPGIHTSTLVTFQLATMPQAQQPTPAPDPVITPAPTPPREPPGRATFYVNVVSGANLRAAPDVEAEKLTAAAYRQVLRVITSTPTREWVQVEWDGQSGWVLAALLSATKPAPLEPVLMPPVMPAATIDPLTALAFLQVESANRAFTDGLITIRFEVHVLKAELNNDALFDMHFKFTPGNYSDQWWRPSPNAEWINAHGAMDARHKLLAFARGLNDTAALRSTGLGSAQVMGANHARVGYATPQAMFAAFKHPRYGVNAQVLGFVNYVLSDPALADALRRRDWWEAVTRYNGEGQQAHYGNLLEQALAQIRQEIGA